MVFAGSPGLAAPSSGIVGGEFVVSRPLQILSVVLLPWRHRESDIHDCQVSGPSSLSSEGFLTTFGSGSPNSCLQISARIIDWKQLLLHQRSEDVREYSRSPAVARRPSARAIRPRPRQ